MSNEALSVGIVGGGFSGICIALHLQRYSTQPIEVHVFESGTEFGLGPAYAWRNPCFLLNGEADHLSMFEDDPDGFVNWISSQASARSYCDPERTVQHQFMPRFVFSDYSLSLLKDALQRTSLTKLVLHAESPIMDCSQENRKLLLHDSSGRCIAFDRVVLATGNEAPQPLVNGEHGCCIENPWERDWVRRIPPGDVLLVGAGQTMIDACIALRQSNHQGRLIAISRRGVRTTGHLTMPSKWTVPASSFPGGLLDAMRFIRREIRLAEAAGVHWSAVTDACRPLTLAAWKGFSAAEKQRYFEHLAPYWWGYRQRVAPRSAAQFEDLLASGYLTMYSARLLSLDSDFAGNFDVALRLRKQDDMRLRVKAVVNCTGPNADPEKSANPFMQRLLQRGMIRPHCTRIGLDITEEHRVIDCEGQPSEVIYVLGALARGAILEALAIRDIRRQADKVTKCLLREQTVPKHVPMEANMF